MIMFHLGKLYVSVMTYSKVSSNAVIPTVVTQIAIKFIKPMFTTSDILNELFGIDPTGGPFVLCRKCYNETYSTICGSQSKNAVHVGINPKRDCILPMQPRCWKSVTAFNSPVWAGCENWLQGLYLLLLLQIRTSPLCSKFYPSCYDALLKFSPHYA